MLKCLNEEDTLRVREIQEMSGLADFDLRSQLRHFQQRHGRLPELDELKGSNSEPYLRDHYLQIGHGSSTVDKLLSITKTQSVDEAIVALNDKFRDLEIRVNVLNKKEQDPKKQKYYISVEKRPTVYVNPVEHTGYEIDESLNNRQVITEVVDKLQSLYGIQIKPITSAEIRMGNFPSGSEKAKGFVYNGDIYINSDTATADTKVHELLHVIFGSVKMQNRMLYDNLMQMAP